MPSPFTFSTVEPAANSSPGAVSRPAMQLNNVSTNDILSIDHVTFNNITGGTHQKVTYIAPAAPAPPSGTTSIAYTVLGVADNTIPQNVFQNAKCTFPMSAVRAFGSFTMIGNPGPPTLLNQYNVAGITGFNRNYVVTLNTNATNTNNVVALVTLRSGDRLVAYSFGANVLTINVQTMTLPFTTIDFVILQF